MKNVIYEFYGCTALDDADMFITQCLGLGIDSSCIDMMQDSNGTDNTIAIGIAVYTTMSKHLMINAFADKLCNM